MTAMVEALQLLLLAAIAVEGWILVYRTAFVDMRLKRVLRILLRFEREALFEPVEHQQQD